MEIYEAIHKRRTVHQYLDHPVDPAVLDRIVAAGHMAPNHRHTWPWRFLIVGRETRTKLGPVAIALKAAKKNLKDAARTTIRQKLMNPGGLIVVSQVVCDDDFQRQEDYAAASCAVQNMLLAACAEGLGGKWGSGGVTRAPETYQILGIDAAQETIIGFIWIGVPKTVPTVERPSLDAHVQRLP